MGVFYLLYFFLFFGVLINTKKQSFYLFVSFVILFVLAAFRDVSVGTDTVGYEMLFNRLVNGIDIRQEFGWVYLNKLIIYFGGGFNYVLILASLLALIPVFYVSKKYSVNPMLSIFLYYSFYIYLQSFNIMRQTIAVGFVLVAYTFLLRKAYMNYFLIVILASFFHITSLLCLPMVFVNKIPDKIPVYLILIFGSLFLGTFLGNFIMNKAAFLFGYLHYLDKFDSGVGIGLFIVLVNVFSVFVIFTVKERDTLFKMFIVYIVFVNLAVAVPFGYRIIFYFTIVQILFLPKFIKSNRFSIKKVVLIIVILYGYLCFSRSVGSGEVIPYFNTLF